MKEAIMCASILTAIILCVVGITKLFFKKLKASHPKVYKAVFCGLSLVLSIVAPIITELCILKGQLYSGQFLAMICATVSGVFGLYHSYDNLGLKDLVKTLVAKLGELFDNYSEKRITKIAQRVNEVNQKPQDENTEETKAETETGAASQLKE